MERDIFRIRLAKAVRRGVLTNKIQITKKALERLQGCEHDEHAWVPTLTSGLYRGSRGTSSGREDVEYTLAFQEDGSVRGIARPSSSFEYEVRGRYNAKENRYMWAETRIGCGYTDIQDVGTYCNHVSSLALLNHSKLSVDGAVHVEASLTLVPNDSDSVSLVGDYVQSDGKSGDQRLVFISPETQAARDAAQSSEPSEGQQHQPCSNPWTELAVARKASQRIMGLEAHTLKMDRLRRPAYGRHDIYWLHRRYLAYQENANAQKAMVARYSGSRDNGCGQRTDVHYCLKFMSGKVRGVMFTNGNIYEVDGWQKPGTNMYEWGEVPMGSSCTQNPSEAYHAAQAASLALLHGTGLVKARAHHVEVSLKRVAAASTCLIGDFACSAGIAGDQRLVLIDQIQNIDPSPALICNPYSGVLEGRPRHARWVHIPVVSRAKDRMVSYMRLRQNGWDLDDTVVSGLTSGKFRGSRGEADGRVDVEYDLQFLRGDVVTGRMTTGGVQFEVAGWYNAAFQRFEWAETVVGGAYKDIDDVDEYCEHVVQSFLFPGLSQGRATHVEVAVKLVQHADSACLIGDCTLRDGTTGDLRLVSMDQQLSSAPPIAYLESTFLQSYESTSFSHSSLEILLEKEALLGAHGRGPAS